jgi:hypothetical protein
MYCGLGCSFQSGVAAAGPRAVIRAAAPCGGATTRITWGLRAALLRRWRSAGRGYRQDPGWRPCSQRRTCGDPPVANARAAPAAPPPPGGCRRSRPEAIGGVVREDAHDPVAALDFLIDPLQQVGTPDLSQWSLGKWRNFSTSSLASCNGLRPTSSTVRLPWGSAPPARRPDHPSVSRFPLRFPRCPATIR